MLIIHEIGHVLIYLAAILSISIARKDYISLRNILVGLFVTIFLDLDHLFDFYLDKGALFDVNGFLSGTYFALSQKVYVPLHSWELVLLLLIIFAVFRDKLKVSWLFFVIAGIISHIVYDTYYYNFNFDAYFIIFRYFKDFDISVFST